MEPASTRAPFACHHRGMAEEAGKDAQDPPARPSSPLSDAWLSSAAAAVSLVSIPPAGATAELCAPRFPAKLCHQGAAPSQDLGRTHACKASAAPPSCHLGVDHRGLGVGRGVGGLSAGGHGLQLHVGQTLAVTGSRLGTTVGRRSVATGVPNVLWEGPPPPGVTFGVLPTRCESAPWGLRGVEVSEGPGGSEGSDLGADSESLTVRVWGLCSTLRQSTGGCGSPGVPVDRAGGSERDQEAFQGSGWGLGSP